MLLVYQDLLTGDELLSDSFSYKEIENGMLWEVEGSFVGESMHDDGRSMVFAYCYKEGAAHPTFLYFAYGLKEVKC
ncbi:hypothetical protein OPV22_007755 [Ensete ventricosum]|uniref:TCTP domain-containing protein n=1 Tax=Ensete ventricosum TaxID=4639 RepID=A0AAV8RUL3_ENSVE|nr:hypothetical protein OPV22_007755 [Ensete ventricosum]